MIHLAIDIGASSGRHILGEVKDGKLQLQEVYRFENNLKTVDGHRIWDIENLVSEVKAGIKHCAEIGKIPDTVAIDTWAVDYVLLDENGQELLPVYNYRDDRTNAAVPEVEAVISQEELYRRTGIQKQNFNTIYQLWCDKKSGKLEKARTFLMIPEYLSYKLTGLPANEYTNASTTGMVSAVTRSWDQDIIDKLGYPKLLFGKLSQPGTVLGPFSKEMQDYAGFNATVVFAPSHDTASAVVASPLEENGVYISSGTWSLLGMENHEAITSDAARQANFTNEGGMEYRFRFLKNYMGMWLFQNIRRNLGKKYSYDEMMFLAEDSQYTKTFNVNDPRLVAPDNMIDAIQDVLGESLPLGDLLNSTYHSLAKSYADAVQELETITGKTTKAIHIVGGGCQDKYLNALTTRYTGKPVTAGPVEATATGNIVAQLVYSGECADVDDARELVRKSFDITEVQG